MKYLYPLLILFLFNSCKKEIIEESSLCDGPIPLNIEWEEVNIGTSKYLLNMQPIDKYLAVATPSHIFRIGQDGNKANNSYTANGDFKRQTPMSKNYYLDYTLNSDYIQLFDINSFNSVTGGFIYFIENILPDSVNAVFWNIGYMTNFAAINSETGQFLISASISQTNPTCVNCHFDYFLCSIKERPAPYLQAPIDTVHWINYVGSPNQLFSPQNVYAFHGRFFANTGNGLIVVEPNGSWYWGIPSHVPDNSIRYMLSISDTLWAFSSKTVFKSYDHGKTWNISQTTNNNVADGMYNIEDNIVYSNLDQIYTLIPKENSSNDLESQKLANFGLENNQITDIKVFNDYVYVSTLSGLFRKPLEHFFEPKE